ncbi:hypothetical protein [Jiangella anatolica]|uniref:hypothetical protein n=1 Tax=Jiangella anatolica TaxID=2670374 RepID=UPI0011B5F0C7|nr:hypothetical protein [Jiangella anatolica]
MALFAPAETLWVYDSQTAGTRLTNLQTIGGSPITEVTSDSNGQIPPFLTPPGVTALWISSADGASPALNPRVLLSASDLFTDIETLDAAIEDIEVSAGVTSVQGKTGTVTLAPSELTPPAATVTSVTSVSAIVGARLVQVGSGYPVRPSGATWVWFLGSADPGSAAQNGDLWFFPES